MENPMEGIIKQVDVLALNAVTLEAGDIPGLGQVLNTLDDVEARLREEEEYPFMPIIEAMKRIVEKVIMGELTDLLPLEKGITQLQAILQAKASGKGCEGEMSSLLQGLGHGVASLPHTSVPQEMCEVSGGEGHHKGERIQEEKGQDVKTHFSQEDREIINDFVLESMENLGTIEVKVMDLEQGPPDMETINSIFRPFHTVKGVSGFLNFNKINKLAHSVESLLDKARNGGLQIDEEIIDLVLESVDLLKRMIENVQGTLDSGVPTEGDVDTEPLIERVGHFIEESEGQPKIPLGEMLVAKGLVSKADLEDALKAQKEGTGKKLGEILVEQKKANAGEVVSALRDQRKLCSKLSLQIKIDTDKLDNMVDMVGELAIAQSMLRQNDLIRSSDDRKLDHIVNQLNQIISALQRTAMALRMVPIRNTFQKMLRLVRDLAKKAGKEVRLVMSGEDTEIDRNMVEEIYEPMVHMIRNAVDHGVEPPEERKRHDKPVQGTICLRAYHKGGAIVIEIEDDGRGLDKEKILKKAVALGLIRKEDNLCEAEIYNLIFHPGFSTAEQVTDISGRGVGMDVVKSKIIDRLRGRVDVESVPAKGTTLIIRLPLTLAMVDGMIVEIAGARYIIPTLSIQESFRPKMEDYFTVRGKGEMIRVRDNLVPLIRLHRLFGSNGNGFPIGPVREPWEGLVVVVENQDRKSCLLVDDLIGQEEIVIKNLGGWLNDVRGLAGGAIMGDGRVGLILDIGGILNIATEEQ